MCVDFPEQLNAQNSIQKHEEYEKLGHIVDLLGRSP